MTIVRVCDGNPVSFTIVTNFHCDNCEILTIVAMLSWNIARFVTTWLCKCNWINLWSIGLLRFYLMWTTNHIAGLNERSANGPIHPDYGRQLQARHEFRSGRFFNYTRCSALAPVHKQLGKKQDDSLLFCVSCRLIGPKCFPTLFR